MLQIQGILPIHCTFPEKGRFEICGCLRVTAVLFRYWANIFQYKTGRVNALCQTVDTLTALRTDVLSERKASDVSMLPDKASDCLPVLLVKLLQSSRVILSSDLEEDDPLLIEISLFMVDRRSVDTLAAHLLTSIPPHGPRFVQLKKTPETEWTDVALLVMRFW